MYNNLGMYLIELREDAAAFAAFDSALEIQRKLAEAHRDSVFFQRSLGTMHNNLAMVFHMRGVFASAQEQYLNAKGVQADLAARFPEERMLQLELARTCHNLGLLYTSSREHFADAEKEYSEALATLDRYRQQLPEDAEGMQLAGSTRFNLAALLGAKGDATGAQRQLEAARSIQLEAAEKYPEPATFLALAKTQVNLGSSLLGQNELQAAAREFAAGRDSLQSLVQRAGGYIPDYHIALGEARHNLAIALGELRRFEEAQAEYVAANAVLTELVSRFPENPSYAVSLANSCMQFGQFTRDRAGPEASLEWFDRAIGALEPLVERAPSARAARVLRNSYLCRAEMRDRLQSFDEGEQDWRRVLALSPKEEQATWRLRRVLSRYLGGLIVEAAVDAEGLLTEDTWQANDLFNFACVFSAASLKSQEKGDAYANLAMEQLQKAVTAGYRNVEQLTNDRDLAALREREDFKALLESLRK
jgi:tetratricopeptide (TPR) repeat protein